MAAVCSRASLSPSGCVFYDASTSSSGLRASILPLSRLKPFVPPLRLQVILMEGPETSAITGARLYDGEVYR